ncbi:MAG: serine hydrolase [Pseudomonadota bacterium]
MKSQVSFAIFALIALGSITPFPALAQDGEVQASVSDERNWLQTRADQVIQILNGEAPPDIFTDGFVAAVPPAQMEAISAQLVGQFGRALAVESLEPLAGNRAALAIRMERAIARGSIGIDPGADNRVGELLLRTFEPIDDSASQIEADLAMLPGKVSWWFGPIDQDSAPIMASEWTEQTPLGSTFKLYVLATLAREVAEGERAWDDVVTLSETRSFPSGVMQNWPSGAPVRLQTLATLMISISDNTATDALIDILGRDAVFQTLVESGHSQPELNDPFLKTREMFLLKAGPEERLAAYQTADSEAREDILDALEDTPVSDTTVFAAFSGGPIAIDVEWFANADDLTALMRFMRETADPEAFEIMAINSLMTATASANWAYAGYKGGSEPGVLNLTWLLTDDGGRDFALVLSWSNEAANIDEMTMTLIAQRILSLPR